jgi:regulator of replication initiation timing
MGKELEDILKQEIFNLKRRITELEAQNAALKTENHALRNPERLSTVEDC